MRYLIVAAFALVLTGALYAPPAPKNPPPLIIYAAGDPGSAQIYAAKLDGSDVKALTDTKANNLFPAPSPDGRQIAFSSDRDGIQHIYVMDGDGKNTKQLTKGEEPCRGPAWSPDAKKIAFTRHVEGRFPNIFVMDADGANARALTTGTEYSADPAWSPDGKRIAFARLGGGRNGFRVFSMDPDGKNVKEVSNRDNGFGFVYPAWSPDSKKLAYADGGENGGLELFVCDADGKNRKQLTKLRGQSGYPVWLPGGKHIVFYHLAGGTSSIRIIDADGGDAKTLIDKTNSPPEGGRMSLKP